MNHIEENQQYNEHQHGFRKKRGTETALALTWEAIAQGKQHGLRVCLTSRDVEKAFDRVWQKGLKYKLKKLNINTSLYKILSNYLEDRTAIIQIQDHKGPPFTISCGVPQGGCLSTTLYTIYTRDIPEKIFPWTHNTLYADDITQVVRGKSFSELNHSWATETQQINQFEGKWMFKTNVAKFKIVEFGANKKQTFHHPRYGLNCNPVDETTVLGLKLTTNGIKKQIEENIIKAKVQLSKMWKFRNLNMKNKRELYLMLVRPLLIYPCIPLHVANNSQMLKLQRMQNKGINFILGRRQAYGENSETRHRLTQLEPINMTLHHKAKNI